MEFTGLSAFPLTPLREGLVDRDALERNVARLHAAGVDSVAVLGSTGAGAYLDREERAAVAASAVAAADGAPVLVGVSALRTGDVLACAHDAAAAGAAGLLLSAMTYQALTDDEVVGLFADVTAAAELPVVLYDNPATTHVCMDAALYRRIMELPRMADVKIPGPDLPEDAMREHVAAVRAVLPATTGVGISGDPSAVRGLLAGCDAWFSVVGGTLPELAVALTRAALGLDPEAREWARREDARLAPLWECMRRHGSLRVVAALAAARGWTEIDCLPRPLRPLPDEDRLHVERVAGDLGLI